MNINRWRKQVGLPPAAQIDEKGSVRSISVAGFDSVYVDLPNPKGQGDYEHILGVIVPMKGRSWFIKMYGPTDVVSSQKANFEAFVKSFKLQE